MNQLQIKAVNADADAGMETELPRMYYRELGARIRTARQNSGKTLQEVATAISLSNQQVAKYESGMNATPVFSLILIARLLEVSLLWLLLGHEVCDGLRTPPDLTTSEVQLLAAFRRVKVRSDRALIQRVAAIASASSHGNQLGEEGDEH